MRDTFLGYYSPDEEQVSELLKSCIVVLDTNVLLGLYRYPKTASEDLLKIIGAISERLWVPYQVGLEYQENRLTVVAEQRKRFHEVRKVLKDSENKLKAELGKLQLRERHSTIDPDEFIQKIHSVFDEFLKELNHLESTQPDVDSHDQLRDRIDSLLKGKIGPPPANQEELEQIYREGESRYEQERPPGYMDKNKEDEFIQKGEKVAYRYNGLSFQRKYGDLILWKQLVKEAKQNDRFKSILLVTDDDKEDWWRKVKPVNSRKEKSIGPRPELVSEMLNETKTESFYMYSSSEFMKLAERYLNIDVKEESIKQVQDIVTALRSESQYKSIQFEGFLAEKAVFEWLKVSNPESLIKQNEYGPVDFVVVDNLKSKDFGHQV